MQCICVRFYERLHTIYVAEKQFSDVMFGLKRLFPLFLHFSQKSFYGPTSSALVGQTFTLRRLLSIRVCLLLDYIFPQ